MYITGTEWAKLRGVTKAWACRMASEGRIEGAVREGWTWQIPIDAPMPEKRIAQGVEKRAAKVAARRAMVHSVAREREQQARLARIVYLVREGGTVRVDSRGNALLADRHGDVLSVIPDWTEADEVFYQARLADSNNQSK